MHNFDHIIDALSQRTQRVFDTAYGADRYRLLTRRLDQVYGALELARLLDFWLARQIETHLDAVRRDIEAES
jgi:hypothetical protein